MHHRVGETSIASGMPADWWNYFQEIASHLSHSPSVSNGPSAREAHPKYVMNSNGHQLSWINYILASFAENHASDLKAETTIKTSPPSFANLQGVNSLRDQCIQLAVLGAHCCTSFEFLFGVLLPASLFFCFWAFSFFLRLHFARVAQFNIRRGSKKMFRFLMSDSISCCRRTAHPSSSTFNRGACIKAWHSHFCNETHIPPAFCTEHPIYRSWFEGQGIVSSLRLGIQKHMCRSHSLYGGRPTVSRSKFKNRKHKLMTVDLTPSMFTAKCVIVEDLQKLSDSRVANTEMNELEMHSSKTVHFTEYAPAVFHNLRLLYGVDDIQLADAFWKRDRKASLTRSKSDDLRHHGKQQNRNSDVSQSSLFDISVTQDASKVSLSDNLEKSRGKSAAVFIKSCDNRFLLKSVNDEEMSALLKMLPHYYRHMEKHQDKTLLPWFLGLYNLRSDVGTHCSLTVVMMSNVFTPLCSSLEQGTNVDEQYDLKGSTVNRSIGVHRYGQAGVTYKDLDWLELGHRVHLSSRQRIAMLDQLYRDSAFLESMGVMDYSLLIGVRRNQSLPVRSDVKKDHSAVGDILESLSFYWRCTDPDKDNLSCNTNMPPVPTAPSHQSDASTGGLRSSAEPTSVLYHIGIIDILQKWNARKKAETTLKRVRHLSVSSIPAFSCVDPKTYRARFIKFAKKKVFIS